MSNEQDDSIDALEMIARERMGFSFEDFENDLNIKFNDPERRERLKGIIDCERRSIILQSLMEDEELMEVLATFISAKRDLYADIISKGEKKKESRGKNFDRNDMLNNLD